MPLAVEIASPSALSLIDDPSTTAAHQRAAAPSPLDPHAIDHYDSYITHPDFLQDYDSSPRTPPTLMSPHGLPPDPKQAVWAIATATASANTNNLKKQQSTHNRPIAPSTTTTQPPSGLSAFPSANAYNHIHIVQPYVHNSNGAGNESNKAKEGTAGATSPITNANGCSTSTFSINTSTTYTFANPFCTNDLHSTLPSVANGGSTPANQPPRPANAWILYRSHKMKDLTPSEPGLPRRPQADISKQIAEMWKNETPEIRQHYERLSDLKKAEHLALYPGYRFQPKKKAEKDKEKAELRAEKERTRLANMPIKNYRKPPKSKRGVTVESEDSTPVPAPPPLSAISVTSPTSPSIVTWPETTPTSQPSQAGVASPTARQHVFSYQPYAVPSPGSSSTAGGPSIAPSKRKRTRAKVEVSTSALPSEESVSQPDYTSTSVPHYYAQPAEGTPLFDFAAYNAQQGYMQPYHSSTPQMSSGASSDPNSHPHPTPLYNPADSTTSFQHSSNALSLERVNGEQGFFEFTNVVDPNVFINNPGAEIEFSLPSDFALEFLDGVGLDLGENGLAFDSLGGGGGFAEFSNLASTGDGTDASIGLGSSYDQGGMDSNMLGFSTVHPSNVMQGDPTGQTGPQRLAISTQTGHYPIGHGSMTSPSVNEPFSAVSPTDMEQVPISFYGNFPMHQPSYQPSFSHQPRPHHHQQHQQHQHQHHHGFSQDLSSPIQQTF
ncbi:hypothetical protein FRC20_005805, partial [Serendipita sp. 405]